MNINVVAGQQEPLNSHDYSHDAMALPNTQTTENISDSKIINGNNTANDTDNVKTTNKIAVNKVTASETTMPEDTVNESAVEEKVEVGKHLNIDLDAMSMIMSLLLVLAAIVASAMLLKRFQVSQQQISGLKIITSVNLGNKERVVVVQAGEKQLVLGVTPQQITLLQSLDEPLMVNKPPENNTPHSLMTFLQKRTAKN